MLHLGILWPYSQISDKAGKVAKDKHSSLFDSFVSDEEKKSFYNLESRLPESPERDDWGRPQQAFDGKTDPFFFGTATSNLTTFALMALCLWIKFLEEFF